MSLITFLEIYGIISLLILLIVIIISREDHGLELGELLTVVIVTLLWPIGIFIIIYAIIDKYGQYTIIKSNRELRKRRGYDE